MAILRVDHVGIAVPDLDEAIAFYRDGFGILSVHEEINDELGVREAMLAVGDGSTMIQLLAPLNDDTTLAKFLAKHGPGLQQLAYTVDDIDKTSEQLRAQGMRLIYDEAKARHVRLPGELRAPQGRRRRAGRAGRAGRHWSASRVCELVTSPPKTLPISNLFRTPSPRTGGTLMDQIRAAVNAEDPADAGRPRRPAGPGQLRRHGGAGRRGRHVRRPGHRRQGPAQVAAPAAGADPGGRARARR